MQPSLFAGSPDIRASGWAEENIIAAEALATLGDLAVAQGQYDLALEQFRKAIGQSEDDKTKADYALKSADLLFTLEQYGKAADAYLLVEQFSPPDYALYYSQLQSEICYRLIDDFDRAVAILTKIEADYRFLDYRGTIRLERAEILSQSGRVADALRHTSL